MKIEPSEVCHFRLHGRLSSHTHQVCCALLVADKETGTCALNLRSHHPALIDAGVAEFQRPFATTVATGKRSSGCKVRAFTQWATARRLADGITVSAIPHTEPADFPGNKHAGSC